ncbi:putative acetyltransferase [Clostridium acetobutylicum]|uniref:Predicted acetyltransferase n=1 Tax=Clostridium acetobutylicum (strain ATCC 824 / DSM 792 / JCM 1419 / IAM 19013 / LMG 5710 / NBRC 13948 / NRRL B-527 / VKM B-1787 / 2291 / W) TaxID=272562 RepID=Q97G82_CLOAB|nr:MULTISPECIES: GNAT family N-acetyltransferase [Clostridium]AAK80441.1 Predicted acetyltransferase [Clostridium acetobutylicum ATCC 824]ADZ21538.1 acetyltransferase [Clostridium acetobutylicum EA 2018]AEI32379.1 acetyltransferase [Clostridium acetobutylicum DSM 1731]AWV79142.1 GNAT family acetyltransferase [Clostridium acetobutylicum]MBC2394895.1 GNAT family N-acetyltransferase [Clostridium acetobutylicum]
MKLLKPSIKYKNQVLEYKKEFIKNHDTLAGTSYLADYDSYEDWMKFVLDNEKENTKHTGVPAHMYLAVREADDKLVGMINIRHTLNEYLYNYGGHIGYSVKRDERRKGYAKEMLKMALKECKKLKISKVLVTCDSNNIASAKTIKSCGGILENEILDGDKLVQRYWIEP